MESQNIYKLRHTIYVHFEMLLNNIKCLDSSVFSVTVVYFILFINNIPLWIYHNLSISLLMGIWFVSCLRAVICKAAINIYTQAFVWIRVFFFLNKYLPVACFYHKIGVCLTMRNSHTDFPM